MTIKNVFRSGLVLSVLAVMLLGVSPLPTLAQSTDSSVSATTLISEGLQNTGEGIYSQEVTATTFIGNLIRTLLAATGIIFLVITVYAGVLYMTAAGKEDQIKKAKGMLTNTVIGLIIVVGAYAITTYVIDAIATAATTAGTTST